MPGLVILAALATGCVDTYEGTRLAMNFSVAPGVDRSMLVVPTPGHQPGEAGYYSHYELHANIQDGGWVRLKAFIIQPSVHPHSPCLQYLPDTFCVDHSDYPCDPYMNMQRFASLQSILAVVSAPVTKVGSASGFEHWPGYDFALWPDDLFVDPDLTPDASKLHRDNLNQDRVEEFCSDLPDGYYVGNPSQLTFPTVGLLYGVVDGPDPRTGVAIGGISLTVSGKLHNLTELLLTRESDPSRISDENRDRTDLLPGADGQAFLVGQLDGPFGSISRDKYRGLVSVKMESPYNLPVSMDVVVFEDIDEDPINF